MRCLECFLSPMRALAKGIEEARGVSRGKTRLWLVGAALVATAAAQPPDAPPPGRPLPPHPDPLRRALDTNGDHELDADEIAKAAESLEKLDADGDGRITREELFPRPPEGWPGRGPEGRDGEGRSGPPGPGGGPPRERAPGGPPPPREGEGFRPPPGPDPDRLVERAMTFDADGDGKLDRAELGKFAEEMMGRMRPRDQERPGRERPEPRAAGADGERPERPRRPDGERPADRPRRPFNEEDRPSPSPQAAPDGA